MVRKSKIKAYLRARKKNDNKTMAVILNGMKGAELTALAREIAAMRPKERDK